MRRSRVERGLEVRAGLVESRAELAERPREGRVGGSARSLFPTGALFEGGEASEKAPLEARELLRERREVQRGLRGGCGVGPAGVRGVGSRPGRAAPVVEEGGAAAREGEPKAGLGALPPLSAQPGALGSRAARAWAARGGAWSAG